MKFIYNLIICFFIFVITSCKESNSNNYILNEKSLIATQKVNFNYLPTSTTKAVYNHKTYTLSYNEKHEQAEWVAYFLKQDDIKNINYDRPYFELDESIQTGSAHWRNYKKSGYNKGHLLPAGDRKGNYEDYKETFLTSNISPQSYAFNSGVWNRLEQKVRYWAEKYNGLYVVTAGVLDDGLKTIGYEKVSVPKYFYKVLLTSDKTRMIGFLVPHKDTNQPLYSFVVSVDKIESLTGIDFFPDLEDNLENKLESNTNYKEWSF